METKYWSREEILSFIEEVKTYRYLWDKSSPDFKNRRKKHEAWEEVARKMNINVEEATKKFRNLRTQFAAELKKMQSCSAAQNKRKWPFFDPMSCMEEPWNIKQTILERDEPPLIPSLDPLLNENATNNVARTSSIDIVQTPPASPASTWEKTEPPRKKNKHSKREILEMTSGVIVAEPQATVITPKPHDNCQTFGDFVAGELRSLKPKYKSILKCRIMKEVMEVIELQENEQGTSAMTSTH